MRLRALVAFGTICCMFAGRVALAAPAATPMPSPAETAELQLGKRLFNDPRLTNPGMDFQASCQTCHVSGDSAKGVRLFADSQPRSFIPSRREDGKRLTLRNTPTLIDVADMPRLGWDGHWASLNASVKEQLTGDMLGWGSGQEKKAREEIYNVLTNDAGEGSDASYKEQIKRAYGKEIGGASQDEVVDAAIRAISKYAASIKSTRTALYDAYTGMNRMNVGPSKNEPVEQFAGRLLSRYKAMEDREITKVPDNFPQAALDGFKIFYTTYGEKSVGNCVACHVPPTFTDFKFHNTGVTQMEYDGVHGGGSFAKLEIPNPENGRPAVRFLAVASKDKLGEADLGYWNFAPADEAANAAGAFKTPTLRNLTETGPYMHNGAYATLEDTVKQKVRACAMAKSGELRAGDPEMKKMNITEADVAPLVAFLKTINDVGREHFRDVLITAHHLNPQ